MDANYERLLKPTGKGLTLELAQFVNRTCGHAFDERLTIAALYYRYDEYEAKQMGIELYVPKEWIDLYSLVQRDQASAITFAVGGVLRAQIETIGELRATPFSNLVGRSTYLGPKRSAFVLTAFK